MSDDTKLKPPKTFEEQLKIMRERGLIINDDDFAIDVLKRVNYYRLSAYTLTVKNRNTNKFYNRTTFEHVFNLYEFDRKLRHLLVGILEIIEITFRTRIAYELGHSYGTIGYQQSDRFVSEEFHKEFLDDLNKSIRKNQEVFIDHHLQKYDGQFPIWVAVELISFGTISKLFKNMIAPDQEKIASKYYYTSAVYLANWIHAAVHLRNICAHYGRLYNRFLKVTPKMPKKFRWQFLNKSLFKTIVILHELYPSQQKWNDFVTNAEALFEEYKDVIDLYKIGFVENWPEVLRKTLKS